MKKNLAIALVAMLLASLVACGSETPTGSTQPSAAQTTDNGQKNDPADPAKTDDGKTETGMNERPDKSNYRTSSEGVKVEADHASGLYTDAFSLGLSSESGATIYYTTDGSDPMMSKTAVKYANPIEVKDRSGEANVVSAVDPDLFSGNFVEQNADGTGYDCYLSAPSDNAVDKIVTIRAVACDADEVYGPETTLTYFLGTMEEHIQGITESCAAAGQTLMVVSLSMDYQDLFNEEYGIYVLGSTYQNALKAYLLTKKLDGTDTIRRLAANYNQKGMDWEREAGMTMMECDANGAVVVLDQNCGVRIQGNYSRSDYQKGFRLIARSDYGMNNFNYAVFGNGYTDVNGETMDKFKSLILRNGGNCAFTCKYNDSYWQSLVGDLDVSTQQARPCVVYMNGEYWGLYILEEDYSNDYFADKYDVSKDDVVVYKGDAESLKLGYKLDEGLLPEGETDESYYMRDLLNFFDSHSNCESQADYDALAALVDPQSVMDYFAVQCWINNKWDWPGKNWSMWRTSTNDGTTYGDGRFRFCFYDLEFGGVSGKGDCSTNTIKEDNYKPSGLLDKSTSNPAVLCFAYLMTNESFRLAFCEELTGLSDGIFEAANAKSALDQFEGVYGPLLEQFFNRYPGTGDVNDALHGGYASSSCIRDFLNGRAKHISAQVKYVYKKFGMEYTE